MSDTQREEARAVLAATPHRAWCPLAEPPHMQDGADRCECDRIERAMLAFASPRPTAAENSDRLDLAVCPECGGGGGGHDMDCSLQTVVTFGEPRSAHSAVATSAEAASEVRTSGPDNRHWRDREGRLQPYPGGRTKAEWDVIAAESIARSADLPDD